MTGTKFIAAVAASVVLVAILGGVYLLLLPADTKLADRGRVAGERAQLRPTEADPPITTAADARAGAIATEERPRVDAARQQAAQPEAAGGAAARPQAATEEAQVSEAALGLGPVDRQRLQVALSAQGFDTRGRDGVFGPRTREMVQAWQQARSLPPTGFLDASQRLRLLAESAEALVKFDEARKKAQDERKDNRQTAARDMKAPTRDPSWVPTDPARQPPASEKWSWRARSALVEEKSRLSCRKSTRAATVYSFDYVDRVLTVIANDGQNVAARVAADGSFNEVLRPDIGPPLIVVGNTGVRTFELFQPDEGCRWKLVPYDFLIHH